MSSTIETGHAKNVANFKLIKANCKSFKSKYNPSDDSIKLTAQDKLITDAEVSLKDLKKSEETFKKNVNKRVAEFEPLSTLSVRVVNSLESCNPSPGIVKDARSILKKIQGKRAKPKDKPAATDAPVPDDKSISVSQLSYDSQVDNFDKLVILVSGEDKYMPNEPELSVAGLEAKLAQLQSVNSNVVDSITEMSNARNLRDQILYAPGTGMVDVAQSIKKYLLSVYKATAPEYKQVRKIQIKDHSRKK
jgi:hypothetical protein